LFTVSVSEALLSMQPIMCNLIPSVAVQNAAIWISHGFHLLDIFTDVWIIIWCSELCRKGSCLSEMVAIYRSL